MKNKILFGAGLSACCVAWAAKDPVVMNVNGIDVHRSEFEYLFHKNNRQQLVPQSLDDYKELFEIYKLKVADAKAAGLDTLASFRKEMNQYRRELASPYLTDSIYIEQLVKEFADRAKEDVQARHIMLFKNRGGGDNSKIRARLDSIRSLLIGGADFETLAQEFSEDPSVARNKGNLGFIKPGRYPYDFETAAYSLKEDEISGIVESPQAFHILKGGKRRPARGKVEVSHILLLSGEGDDAESREMTKQKIDSLYRVAKADPDKFADLAQRFSQDPGSARQGGHLPSFGPGEMVPEFEAESYTLKEGEIGMPFKTSYGWHIVKKHKDIPVDVENEARMDVNRALANPQSEKSRMLKNRLTKRLAAKHKGKIISSSLDEMVAKAQENGMDSVFFSNFSSGKKGEMPLVTINGKKFTVGEFLAGAGGAMNLPPQAAESVLRTAADNFFSMKLLEEEENWLYG
ncbi:MAG: peptidylprolyl isomerase, partial [Muribaculaceae bacterium]|nr:peptidylprolyl isomerase [Muribaculaceae bacterium]